MIGQRNVVGFVVGFIVGFSSVLLVSLYHDASAAAIPWTNFTNASWVPGEKIKKFRYVLEGAMIQSW